jgi:hypothetical protein|tara:strand:+ start:3622 stop:3783 length:162 start_codon:yes stop_codon:yes gene_type:complete
MEELVNKISEQELIKEMTDPKASIKNLLDAARGDIFTNIKCVGEETKNNFLRN